MSTTAQHTTDDFHSCSINVCPLLAQELSEFDFDVRQKSRFPVKELLTLMRQHRFLYAKVLSVAAVASVIIALSIPNYYTCRVMLAPELSASNKGTGSLASLASNFGLSLSNAAQGADALFPTLYPDLMNSVAFRASLFPIMVEGEGNEQPAMSYYDYLHNAQRQPWWNSAVQAIRSAIASLFVDVEESNGVNPFKLTKEQYEMVKLMEEKVVCNVDKMTLVITINVTDQDPLIAATLADSVQLRLQEFITDYRTRKARIDLEYNKKLFAEAKDRYDEALSRSAAFNDANQHAFLDRVRSQRTKLENEVSLQYAAYSQVAAQLRIAEAKVQEETPAFTTLQPATVPVEKAGPKRSLLCIIFMVLTFLGTTFYLLATKVVRKD